MTASVAVIVTARNAAETIADAVSSALAQPEVAEVVVVDDASTDATGDVAKAAGDGRVVVLRSAVNIGPSAARNLAIAGSTAPLIAILDADDSLLPGRFARLLAQPDWDLIADNIVFVPDTRTAPLPPMPAAGESALLGLADFVRGNIARGGLRRGELGFLKPVIRRRILPQDGPVYDPAMWLGEDYDLYVRLLQAGARFRLTPAVGYAARVRAGSLSGRHRTADLQALLAASQRHAASGGPAAGVMRAHARQVRGRWLLRAFLDRKAADGLRGALAFALKPPSRLGPIALGILRDKLARFRPAPPPEAGLRTLLPLLDGFTIQPGGTSPSAQAPASSAAMPDSR